MTRTRLLMMLVAGVATAAFISIGCGGSGYLSEFPTEVGDGAIVHIENEAGTPYGYGVEKGYARDPVQGDGDIQARGIVNVVEAECNFHSFVMVNIFEGEIKADVGECSDPAHCLILTTVSGDPCSFTLIGQLKPEKVQAGAAVTYSIDFNSDMWTSAPSDVGSLSFIMSDDNVADPLRLNLYALNLVSGPNSLSDCLGAEGEFAYDNVGVDPFFEIFPDMRDQPDRLQDSMYITTVTPNETGLGYCSIGWTADAVIDMTDLMPPTPIDVIMDGKIDYNVQVCDSRNATECAIGDFSASVP